MSRSSDFNVLFLNIDLGNQFTGIESAAMIRGRIMGDHLHLPTRFLSLYFNPKGYDNFLRFQEKGLVSPSMEWVNLFDWLNGALPKPGLEPYAFTPPENCVMAPVEGTPHDQRLYCQGQVVAYVKFDDLTGRLLFINYLRHGKIWKRDWLGWDGKILRTDFVDPVYDTPDPVMECFWAQDGTPALIRDYEFVDKKQREMRSIQLYKSGNVSQYWSDLNDLHEHFLAAQLDFNKVNVLILDRSSEFGPSALKLKEKHPDAVKLVGMVHNTHYVHGIHTPGDPMTSEVSSFYKEMLLQREKFDALVFLTQEQKDDVVKRFGPGRYHVIPHAYQALQDSPPLERDLQKIVIPGRFAEEKQPLLALEAFSKVRVKFPDARLHFYGYGDKRDSMIEAIERHGMAEAVHLHDFDPDIDLVFQTAGLMLCSSRNEGFCISVLEAIRCGCPVVAFDCKYGPGEIIQDGVNGYLCPPQDVASMAQSMEQIFSDPSLHKRLIHQSPESVLHFSEQRVAQRWAELLDAWVPKTGI